MKKDIHELQKIADVLRKERDRFALEVREGGKQSQHGFEWVIRAVHRIHNLLFTMPEKLESLAKDLRK